jgi:hypothetical protein
MSGSYTIVVDQRAYEVEASEGSVRARHRDLELALPRWSAAQHLDALRRHLVPGPAGLELDGEGYAAEVLARTDAPVTRWGELVPLALWWATRPELDGMVSGGESMVLHEGVRAQMRECTWHQRMAAARHGLVRSDDGVAIDPVQVMEQLLEHLVEGIDAPDGHPVPLDELAGSSLVRLSNAVLDRSSREAPFTELLELEEAPAQARELLELCRVLGYTPTQVFALPAAEVDLVRELMRRATVTPPVRATAPARSHAPLHDAPDAIVIDFGNGGST